MEIMGMEINGSALKGVPEAEAKRVVKEALKAVFGVDNPSAMLEIDCRRMEGRVSDYIEARYGRE